MGSSVWNLAIGHKSGAFCGLMSPDHVAHGGPKPGPLFCYLVVPVTGSLHTVFPNAALGVCGTAYPLRRRIIQLVVFSCSTNGFRMSHARERPPLTESID